jgi:DNA-binding response OmpR family regulator
MKKVLIVEDDELLRMFYEMETSEMGYDVILAKDGEEALDKVRKENPDLVVLDLVLPNMNGLDCLWRMLSINSSLPVIINSAYSHYKDNFMSWAAKEYVIKSGDLSKLKNAIKRVLSEEQLSKEKPLILKELHGD